MGLREELGAFRAEFIRNAPPARAELYDLREWRRQLGTAGAGHLSHSRQPTSRARRHRGGLPPMPGAEGDHRGAPDPEDGIGSGVSPTHL